jgi:hypothetical protein
MALDYICAGDHKGEEKRFTMRGEDAGAIPCGTIQRRGLDGLAKRTIYSGIERISKLQSVVP